MERERQRDWISQGEILGQRSRDRENAMARGGDRSSIEQDQPTFGRIGHLSCCRKTSTGDAGEQMATATSKKRHLKWRSPFPPSEGVSPVELPGPLRKRGVSMMIDVK